MSISRTRLLSKPVTGQRVAQTALAYMRARAKRRAYDLVIKEFKRSGITKAELARRLGKGAPEISRMLGGPANWTIQTVADLLFAISGAEPTWSVAYSLDRPARNATRPEWVTDVQVADLRELKPFAVSKSKDVSKPKIVEVWG